MLKSTLALEYRYEDALAQGEILPENIKKNLGTKKRSFFIHLLLC